jgi:GNAT superfamily N-acetyltransferase
MALPKIDVLAGSETVVRSLAAILVEVVAGGGSVSFMHPLEPGIAERFWRSSFERVEAGERVILGAWTGDDLVGTVTLDLCAWPNQPHRAEIGKMMTRPGHRGQGVATQLMQAAEALAASRGRFLIVLDTAADEGAAGFYEKRGYAIAGRIPDYALKPHGGLTDTIIFWKRLAVPDA